MSSEFPTTKEVLEELIKGLGMLCHEGQENEIMNVEFKNEELELTICGARVILEAGSSLGRKKFLVTVQGI